MLVALVADQRMAPLEREFMTPLDEGMVMDMPITVPRASVTEAVDDLKERDMVLCRFPEVDMVVGKAGRAETPTDPAPMDMIETMVNFRPQAFWPRRKLRVADAMSQGRAVCNALVERGVIQAPESAAALTRMVEQAVEGALPYFDAASREYAYHRNQEMLRDSAGVSPTSASPADPAEAGLAGRWRSDVAELDGELLTRAAPIFTRFVLEQLLDHATIVDPAVAAHRKAAIELRETNLATVIGSQSQSEPHTAGHHHGTRPAATPLLEPQPVLEAIQAELSRDFRRKVLLWKVDRDELAGFGGELDRAVQMPGWTNVWTMPIQNRVDMLATGVNTPIGIRVLGPSLDDVVRGSEEVARVVKKIPGAVDVVADPIRGKPYIEVRIDRDRAARLGVSAGDVNDLIETALAGKVVTTTIEGRERRPVVIRYGRAWREDEDSIRNLLVPARGGSNGGVSTPAPDRLRQIPLSEVASVQVIEGPATIKSENGLLRNYVRMNVRGRDAADLVAEARQVVAREAKLPDGVFLEWTGQFEHAIRARQTLTVMVPIVVALIFLVLYLTYHDLADAALDDAGRARSHCGRSFLPVAAGTQAVGHGLGRLHRLLRYGHLDGDHHAGIPARGRGESGRPGTDRSGRIAAGRYERGRAPAAAEAAHRGNGRDWPGPDALGQRGRLGDHPPDGRARFGRNPRGRRGDRPVPAGALLLGPPPALGADAASVSSCAISPPLLRGGRGGDPGATKHRVFKGTSCP